MVFTLSRVGTAFITSLLKGTVIVFWLFSLFQQYLAIFFSVFISHTKSSSFPLSSGLVSLLEIELFGMEGSHVRFKEFKET